MTASPITNPTAPDRESVTAMPATMTAEAAAQGHQRLAFGPQPECHSERQREDDRQHAREF